MANLLTKDRSSTAKIIVDYPRQNEIISSMEYAVRLGVPEGARKVEVAIDQGEWQPCRQAVGYWWYDWSGYGEGEHEIIARMETKEGKKASCVPCEFFVRLQSQGKPTKS